MTWYKPFKALRIQQKADILLTKLSFSWKICVIFVFIKTLLKVVPSWQQLGPFEWRDWLTNHDSALVCIMTWCRTIDTRQAITGINDVLVRWRIYVSQVFTCEHLLDYWLALCEVNHRVRGWLSMMTSSNGNIFRLTDPLNAEFTGLRWISRTKASEAELWWFLWSAPE